MKLIISTLKARLKNHQWNTFQYNTFLFSGIISVPNLPERCTVGKELPSHCFSSRASKKQAVSRTSVLRTIILLSPKSSTKVSAKRLYLSWETICSSVFMWSWVAHRRVQVHAYCKMKTTGSADSSTLSQVLWACRISNCMGNGQSHKTLALLIWSWWVIACW